MPLDTSIYQQPPSQGFNTPFQTLAQLGTLQRQQQEIRSAKAEEDLRQQALKDKQKQQEENDRFTAIIGNPDVTPDNFLATVKAKAPEHYGAAQKMIDDAKKNAADLAEKNAQTAAANAQMQLHGQTYIANQGRLLETAGNTPEAFEMMMKIHQEAMPDSKQPDEFRAYVQQHGPASIAQVAKMMQAQSPAVQKQAAEQPGQEAKSTQEQRVLAGTSPTGMTAEQQAAEADRQAQLKVSQGQLGVAQSRLTLEQQKAKDEAAAKVTKTAQGRPLLSSDVNKISDLDKSISELRDLGERLKTGAGMGGVARAEAALVPGGLAPYVPGAEAAKATAADIKLAQQVAGRAVHGGVMRKNDQEQAEQYLPKQDDPPQVVQAKLANILKLANDSKIGHIENLKRGGFDVSGFQSALGSASLRKEIPGHPGSFAVSKDNGQTWQAE